MEALWRVKGEVAWVCSDLVVRDELVERAEEPRVADHLGEASRGDIVVSVAS